MRPGAEPRRALPLRRAAGRGLLGARVRARRLGREHARVQLLLPAPVHTFSLSDSRNWFALAVFVVTAVVVSELAARSRRRARESALLAEIATSLLEHGTVARELERIAAEAARALQVEQARITLGERAQPDGRTRSRPASGASARSSWSGAAGERAAARRRLLPGARLAARGRDRPRAARSARRSRPRRCAGATR